MFGSLALLKLYVLAALLTRLISIHVGGKALVVSESLREQELVELLPPHLVAVLTLGSDRSARRQQSVEQVSEAIVAQAMVLVPEVSATNREAGPAIVAFAHGEEELVGADSAVRRRSTGLADSTDGGAASGCFCNSPH